MRFAGMLALAATTGCIAVSAHTKAYLDPAVPANTIVRRVALVPNRLPANLLEPEKWRKFNWEVASKALRAKGYDVIDYQTSVSAFEKAALPIEDTHSSRDKLAELASALGVDAILIPYYGTFASARPSFLIQSAEFSAVSTFQIYLPSRNDFASRLDTAGKAEYTTGILTLLGLTSIILGAAQLSAPCSSTPCDNSSQQALGQALSLTGGLFVLADMIVGVYYASKPTDSYWESAFDKSIRDSIDVFAQRFPAR